MKEMSNNNYHKVYSTNGTLQAISIRLTLENAGIPTRLAHSNSDLYLNVLVPHALAREACLLLRPLAQRENRAPLPVAH